LLATFVSDATVTLIVRSFRRQRVAQAHRSHAYQHLAVRLRRHRPVTNGFALVNILWLLPICLLLVNGRLSPAFAVTVAYVPIVVLVAVLRAGRDPVVTATSEH
jgi:Fuc2NAc and GlcNAc transferase